MADFSPRDSAYNKAQRRLKYYQMITVVAVASIFAYAAFKPTETPIVAVTVTASTTPVATVTSAKPVQPVLQATLVPVPSPTNVISTSESVFVQKSAWSFTYKLRFKVGEACYGNHGGGMVWLKTGQYMSECKVDDVTVLELSTASKIPDFLAVEPKGVEPKADRAINEGNFKSNIETLNMHVLTKGFKWACELSSKANQDAHPDYTVAILESSQVLAGYSGTCYQISAAQQHQTILFLVSEVNSLVANDPQSLVFLKDVGIQGDLFGKHDYAVVK